MKIDGMKSFRIECDGHLIVAVYVDGKVEFGPGITPNIAAMLFWDAVSEYVQDATPEN